MARTLRWVLAARPEGLPELVHFRLEEADLKAPGLDEVVVAIRYHTIAPGVRAKIAGGTYAAPVELGDVIPAVGVGIVEESRSSALQPGDVVVGELGWAERLCLPAKGLARLDPALFADDLPVSTALSALGPPGLTAYFGVTEIAAPRPGQTILISSAAGAVGSLAGQIAKLMGCRVIGIAGSERKCRMLVEQLGFDAAIDYKREPQLTRAVREAAPDGVDVYYDNVGGEISDAVFDCMAVSGRIVLCGLTSEYNRSTPRGLRNIQAFIARRLTMRGMVMWDYLNEFDGARATMAQWVRDGSIQFDATIVDGIENAARTFIALFTSNESLQTLIRVR